MNNQKRNRNILQLIKIFKLFVLLIVFFFVTALLAACCHLLGGYGRRKQMEAEKREYDLEQQRLEELAQKRRLAEKKNQEQEN